MVSAPKARQWVDERSSHPAGKGGISSLQKPSTEDAVCHPLRSLLRSFRKISYKPVPRLSAAEPPLGTSLPVPTCHHTSRPASASPSVSRKGGADPGCQSLQLFAPSLPSTSLCPEAWPKCQRPVNMGPESIPAHDTTPSLFITT